MDAIPLILVALSLTLFLYSQRSKRSVSGVRSAPGPKPVPILGNVFDLTARELWLKVEKWTREYGPITSLSVLTQPLVFLSSPQVVSDLLDARGAIYSDKPKMVMVGELCGCENMVAFTSYGSQSRRQRRLMGMAFAKERIPAYWPLIEKETAGFLKRLVQAQSDSNEEMKVEDRQRDYVAQIRRYAGQLTLSVVYGYEAKSTSDPFLALAEECVDLLSNKIASGGGIWLVDLFPGLKNIPRSLEWLPFMGFLEKARVWKVKMLEFVDKPYEWVKQEMKNGTQQPSFCSTLLTDSDSALTSNSSQTDAEKPSKALAHPAEKTPSFTPTVSASLLALKSTSLSEFEFDLKWTANSMYSASGDTTITAFALFLLAMMEHPEVVVKARKELDAVTGLGDDGELEGKKARLPRFEDRWVEEVVGGKVVKRPRMPYVEAIMNEVWRWGVPVPLSLPHRLMQDDIYQPPTPTPTSENPNPESPTPILLKKGSLVFGNIWAILRSQELFGPDVDSFNPDRYMLSPTEESILYSPPLPTASKQEKETYERVKKEKKLRDPRSYVFGFGRRQCPGQNLVESSIWLLIATVLSTLDIKRPIEVVEVEDGKGGVKKVEREFREEVKFENSIFRTPNPFRVDIRPRSERALEVIMRGGVEEEV